MSNNRHITKSLAVMDDLATGVGTVQQQRGLGQRIDIPYAVSSFEELKAIDKTKYTKARVYTSETSFVDYSLVEREWSECTNGVVKSLLIAQGLSGNYGFFEKGFNYVSVGDAGIATDGKIYTYVGGDPLPATVVAGTNPVGSGDYKVHQLNSTGERNFGSVAECISYSGHEIGNRYVVDDYYGGATPNNSGVMLFKVVAAGTGTDDGGKYIDIDGVFQLEQALPVDILVELFGAVGDGVTDDIVKLKNANNYASLQYRPLKFSLKTYAISDTFPLKTNMTYLGAGSLALNRSPNTSTERGTVIKWIGTSPTVSISDNTRSDKTASWSTIDATLGFSVDHYTVNYTANTQYLHRPAPNLVSGKTYRVYFSLKDGTNSSVSVNVKVGSDATGSNPVLNEGFTTTPFWEEKSLAFVADGTTDSITFFSTMTRGGNYEIADIRVIEVKSIISEYNCQHVRVENLSIIGDFSYDDDSALCGIDIESFDNVQNSRRGKYENIMIDSCYMGVGVSERIKDSGNTDGYAFENIDIENCHTCVSTYTAYMAYTSFTSAHLSYFKCGFNIKRASWIDFKDIAGANVLGKYGIPETQPSSLFRLYANSGVINMSGCESENAPAGQLYSSQITFEGAQTKLPPTNIRGCDFGNDINLNIQHPTLNIGGNWFHTQSELNINVKGCIVNLTEQNYSLVINENAGAAVINNPYLVTYQPQITSSWEIPELVSGAGASMQVAFPSAVRGDYVMVSCENRDVSGVILNGAVSSAGNVRVTAFNPLGDTKPATITDLSIQLIKSRT